MNAILQFDLTDPDDAREHMIALKGHDLAWVIWDFDQKLRSIIKHESGDLTEREYNQMTNLREELHNLLSERGVNLDEMIV